MRLNLIVYSHFSKLNRLELWPEDGARVTELTSYMCDTSELWQHKPPE